MHISAPFIKRPVATSLLSLAILLAGGVAYFFLPVSALPTMDFPTINVSANLPGASPETMAASVATPLERAFGRISAVTEMTSNSQLGKTGITLQFDLNRDINAAARDVQAAINAAASQLPPGLPSLPSYRKANPADGAVITVNLLSTVIPRTRLYDLADSIVAQRISQLDGVGQTNVAGSSKPAVRVELNPLALAHYQIGSAQVRQALVAANANSPKGVLENSANRWTISASDQLFDPRAYASLIVTYRNGAPVRLGDVATVTEGREDFRTYGLHNGEEQGIGIMVSRQPGANLIAVVDRIESIVPELQASLPPSVDIVMSGDGTKTIRASVKNMNFTLMLTISLVVMVIFLFLRNAWATIIPSVSVPLSLVGTFGVMYLAKYSIDNLSLMALAIVTGFVVDDAIVVIENISRYLEAGQSPLDAAMKGSKEIGPTVLSMSISLISVFIPILMMGGLVGRLFREFAVTLSVAIAVSLCVSLTTTPMMCARFLKSSSEQKHGRFFLATERIFQGALRTYGKALHWVLNHQPITLVLTIATVCLSVYLYIIVPKGFFPQQDTGRLNGTIQGPPDISFDAMHYKVQQLDTIIRQDPAVLNTTTFINNNENSGSTNVELKPLEERKVSADQVIARLRPKLATVAGASIFLQAGQDLRVGGLSTSSQYQYTLQGETLDELNDWAPRIQARLSRLAALRDVTSNFLNRGPQASLQVDRDTASRLGIQPQQIDETLYDTFGQRQVSTMYKAINQYHVVMEVDPAFRDSPDALPNLYVRSTPGAQVPLSAIAHVERQTTSLSVNHMGQFPAITISFNLAPDVSLGDAVNEVNAATLEMGMPATMHATFSGTAQAFQESLKNEPYLILAALMTVYLVLGILYESYIHPITILSTLPSAGVGALLALKITHTDLSVIALVGVILLIGIVQKNAIMMIDFALDAERRQRKSPVDAIYQACLLRFRPIMMTSTAALFGALPLALEGGIGSELRRPLGISIVGGLLVSQMLTLFTTPVIYLYMDRIQHLISGRKTVSAPVSETI